MKTFNEVNTKDPGTALVVDALNVAFRYKHSGKESFAEEYAETILSLAHSYKAGKIIIAADSGTSAYRLALHPEYKLTRKQSFELQTEDEKEAFARFFKEFERALELFSEKFCVLRFKNVEADDIAAYIVSRRRSLNIQKIWLISSDKDWNLLINEDTNQFSTVTRQEIGMENFFELRGVATPDEYLSMKVLMGEAGASSDNVPGIPQVGPKRAIELISKYGSALDILDSLPLPGHYKYIQNVNASADLIELNYQLFDLITYCEDAIGEDNIKEIHKTWKQYNE